MACRPSGRCPGCSVCGPWQSARKTGWLYLYALPLFFIARWPINLAHQALNDWAIGSAPAMMWVLLAIDAIVVGLIVAIIPAISVRVARLVRERREINAPEARPVAA